MRCTTHKYHSIPVREARDGGYEGSKERGRGRGREQERGRGFGRGRGEERKREETARPGQPFPGTCMDGAHMLGV